MLHAQALPRLLWELGGSQPGTSLLALRMLHDAGRYARPGGLVLATLQGLQPQLAPLYASALPASAKGGTKAARQGRQRNGIGKGTSGEDRQKEAQATQMRLLAGPLAQLPPDCQVWPP